MDDAERMQGEELLRKTSWVVTELPDLGVPKVFDHMFLKDPTLRTKHYVVGERSPFIYKGPSVTTPSSSTATTTTTTTTTAADSSGRMIGTVCTYAIYAGHYSINGSYMLQGGAISSIFDYATACIGSTLFNPGSFALTKSVTTKFLRGANPVPGVFKVTCEVIALDLESGSMTLMSVLTNQTVLEEGGRPFATSECVMIDGPRRSAWKAKRKEAESGGSGGSGGKSLERVGASGETSSESGNVENGEEGSKL